MRGPVPTVKPVRDNPTDIFGVPAMEGLDNIAAIFRALFDAYPRMHDWIPVYGFGSLVALFKSFYDPKRRSAGALFAEAFFGGVCAVVAYDATRTSDLQLLWTGAAAVAAGGLVQGIHKAGDQFASKPFDIAERIWKAFKPSVDTPTPPRDDMDRGATPDIPDGDESP